MTKRELIKIVDELQEIKQEIRRCVDLDNPYLRKFYNDIDDVYDELEKSIEEMRTLIDKIDAKDYEDEIRGLKGSL